MNGCETVLMFQGEGHEGQTVPPGRKAGVGLQTEVTQVHYFSFKAQYTN